MFAALVTFLLISILGPVAVAQRSTGTILGTVQDPTGAVVPGAAVTLTNMGTNVKRTFSTDQSGNFAFPALDPGRYMVTVEQAGFKKSTVSDVLLEVEQNRRVDITVQVGQTEQTVEVQADALRVDADTADVSTTMSSRQAAELPVLGRHFSQIVALAPGVIPAMTGGTPQEVWLGAVEGNTWSIGGGRVSGNVITVDGVTANNTAYQTSGVTPSLDAIQEVKVETSYIRRSPAALR